MITYLSQYVKTIPSFDSLEFITPFSEVGDAHRYKGKQVFLKGVTGVPGVIVVRYTDVMGILRYSFNSIHQSLNNGASRIYTLLREKKAYGIQFALIPSRSVHHEKILSALKKEYLKKPLDNHFTLLLPWLTEERTDAPPVGEVNFRRPFVTTNGVKKFSFLDYKGRGGLYLIREKNLVENTTVNVYGGKSISVLWSRIGYKFYPNPHLYYTEIPGVREYYIAAIEVQQSMLPKGLKLDDKLLRTYERRLINLFDTRDNTLGKEVADVELITSSYIPIYQGEGNPF